MKYLITRSSLALASNSNTGAILLKKTTATQNQVALSCNAVRGIYFLAAVFAASIFVCYFMYKMVISNRYFEGKIFCNFIKFSLILCRRDVHVEGLLVLYSTEIETLNIFYM